MFSSHIYVGLAVSMTLMMIAITQASPLHQSHHSANSPRTDKRVILSALVDDVNRCIIACGECSGDLDLPDDKVLNFFSNTDIDQISHIFLQIFKDPEQTLSLVCANTCMETTDVITIFKHLIVKDLMNRSFAKCFLQNTMVIKQ